jgi:hypothetical protein
MPMIKNSTLFYIIDNTDDEESTELQGKLLEMEIKEILDWNENFLFNVRQETTDKVLRMLK